MIYDLENLEDILKHGQLKDVRIWKDGCEKELRAEVERIESYKDSNFNLLYQERLLVMEKLKEILGKKWVRSKR